MADLNFTIGAIEISVVVSSFLLGIATLQTWIYFRRFHNDRWYIKTLVVTVYGLDVIHSALVAHSLYYYTISYYGHPTMLLTSVWSFNTSVALHGLIDLVVEGFYCLRIYSLTESLCLSCLCGFLAVARFVLVQYSVVNGFIVWTFAKFLAREHTLLIVTFSVVAGTDALIALTMCAALYRLRGDFQRTNDILDKISMYVWGSGLLTSLGAVAELVTILTMPNFVWFALIVVMVKVFTNSLLASLNSRTMLPTSYPRKSKPTDASGSRVRPFSELIGMESFIDLQDDIHHGYAV